MTTPLLHEFVRSACESWYMAKYSSPSRYDPAVFTKAALILAQSDVAMPENVPMQVVGMSQVQDVLSGAMLMSTHPGSGPTKSVNQEFSTHLLDLGLSPWQDQGLSTSMMLAIECGADQFIARALQLTGAPSPQQFLLARTSRGVEILETLSASPYGASVLSRVLPLVQSLDKAAILRALKSAAPDSVPHLLPLAQPLSTTQLGAIQQAWTRQLGKNRFTQNELKLMIESLSSSSGGRPEILDSQTIARNAKLSKLVSFPWANLGSSTFSMNNAKGIPVDSLASFLDIPSGPFSGRWTGWAAASMHLIKSCGNRGVYPYSFNLMTDSPGNLAPGVLSSTLGVEWRPGIQLDGVVWLAIHGREDRGSHYHEFMPKVFSAAGISDPEKWHSNSMGQARLFTIEIMSRRSSQPAGQALSHAWLCALSSDPAKRISQNWSMREKLELIKSLTFNYFTVNDFFGAHRNACVAVFKAMVPDIEKRALQDTPPDPQDPSLPETMAYLFLSVSASMAQKVRNGDVITSDKQHLKLLAQRQNKMVDDLLDSVPGTFPESAVSVVEAWAKACLADAEQDNSYEKRVLAWCRSSRLSFSYPARPRPAASLRQF